MLRIDENFFRFLFIFACIGIVCSVAVIGFLFSVVYFAFKHEREQRKIRCQETQQLLQDIDSEYRSTGRF